MKIKSIVRCLLAFMSLFLFCSESGADDLFLSSGRKLKSNHRKYIQDRIKVLRDTDYKKRFDTVKYLINLDKLALPFLLSEAEQNSNMMIVRCIALALSEINDDEAIPILEKLAYSSGRDRDERVAAVLALGKQETGVELTKMRALINSGENRFLRKAAALALACSMDRISGLKLLKISKSEREKELVSIFLLAGCMIGGEDVIKEIPQLLKQTKGYRRAIIALGSAFLADPVLLPDLIKYGSRDKDLHNVLSISLGRYRSPDALNLLTKIISGADIKAAENAIYSLGFQEEEKAKAIYRSVLDSSGYPFSVKAHCILALVDADLLASFLDQLHKATKDQSAVVRSAAVLALKNSKNRETSILLAGRLEIEKDPAVISDLLIVLGLIGGAQHIESIESRVSKLKREQKGSAEQACKVMAGKLDVRVLEDIYNRRLSDLSASWSFRLRDRVMSEIYKSLGLEQDRITRRVSDESSGSQGDGSEGDGESGGGDDGESNSGEGGEDGQSSGGDTQGKKKVIYRYHVMEWDLLLWFKEFPYFPESTFRCGE